MTVDEAVRELMEEECLAPEDLLPIERRISELELQTGDEVMDTRKFTVGRSGKYKTIQDAWDSVDGHADVSITVLDDHSPTDESYPINLEVPTDPEGNPYRRKVSIAPESEEAGVLGQLGDGTPTIVIRGGGIYNYKKPLKITGFTILGGGIRVSAMPFAKFEDLLLITEGIGIACLDDSRGEMYGTEFESIQAWNCKDHAFYLHPRANAHGSTFTNCHATACRGIGMKVRGANITIEKSVIQLNYEEGVEARGCMNLNVEKNYIEGNGRGEGFPIEMYGESVHNATIANNYFNGINPRSTVHNYDTVCRGINFHHSKKLKVEDNTYRNLVEGFVWMNECPDATVEDGENYTPDNTKLLAQ